jgi:hypothetical protein
MYHVALLKWLLLFSAALVAVANPCPTAMCGVLLLSEV